MTHWIDAAKTLENSGRPYVMITVLGARGSTPRDSGTKMLVSEERNYCTIGGGHLEYKALEIAQTMLRSGEAEQRIENFPLGARLGQCCGGSTSVLFESFPGSKLNIMLFGAGHVGKALVSILEQLPCRLWWVDTREEQLPEQVADNVTMVLTDTPADEVGTMPTGSYYIVMTHSHPMDFDITAAAIKRADARYVGLIGSDTKWQRFQMRFEHHNYPLEQYTQVHCPVGLAAVPGKLPIEVAISIAGEIIGEYHSELPPRQTQRGIGWRQLKTLVNEQSVEQEIEQGHELEAEHSLKSSDSTQQNTQED